jgi:hypothetical protein
MKYIRAAQATAGNHTKMRRSRTLDILSLFFDGIPPAIVAQAALAGSNLQTSHFTELIREGGAMAANYL